MQSHQQNSSETPCKCPRCGWLGTFHDAHEYRPTDADFNELEPINVCPRCTDEVEVQTLGQKGLDGLRTRHALLLKGSYAKDATADERDEERRHLERFFEHIGQPLKAPLSTRQAFEKMVLDGTINKRMNEAVQEGIAATKAAREKR